MQKKYFYKNLHEKPANALWKNSVNVYAVFTLYAMANSSKYKVLGCPLIK